MFKPHGKNLIQLIELVCDTDESHTGQVLTEYECSACLTQHLSNQSASAANRTTPRQAAPPQPRVQRKPIVYSAEYRPSIWTLNPTSLPTYLDRSQPAIASVAFLFSMVQATLPGLPVVWNLLGTVAGYMVSSWPKPPSAKASERTTARRFRMARCPL